jgi:uncharacterized protein
VPTVSSLFIYPIKSAQGISLLEMELDERGPRHDRRYMVVDDRGVFLTQRENPRMALLEPYMKGDTVVVTAPKMPSLELPMTGERRSAVRVWGFECEADDLGDKVARWLTDVLEQSCRAVKFPDGLRREVSKRHSALDAEVAFADGYPLLLISLESLADLNRRLDDPVPMRRFRPNVVVRDCQPFEEDEWKTLAAPGLRFDLVKPCTRCKITTLNPDTLEYGKEPLATLAKFRRRADGVIFGQNGIHHGKGRLLVGDPIEVVSLHEGREPS